MGSHQWTFVNLFFFILNAVVGFFSLFIRILESIDLYSSYKTYVLTVQRVYGMGLLVQQRECYWPIISCITSFDTWFYLFYQYFFSKGSFAKTLLHVCLVILLGFGYFGTIAGTSGGFIFLIPSIMFRKMSNKKL